MNDAPQGTAGPAGQALSPPVETAPPEPVSPPSSAEAERVGRLSQLPESADRPTFVFFGVVAAVSLVADVASKAWAEIVLSQRTMSDPSIVVIKDHLSFTLAYNKGGAWGLLQDASEVVRRPFFLAVSVLAILFIVSLYGKLQPGQRALKWGLPLVLGGALGNLSDRITRSSVIDFIDYRADWVASMNRLIAGGSKSWGVTDHWPTFNVADIAICVGVALMGVDMFTSRRSAARPAEPATALAGGSASGNTVPPGPA
jgi:signal peptidase II